MTTSITQTTAAEAAEHGTNLRVMPLTVRTGAELSGVDLRRLDETEIRAIRAALLAHRVVFFRDQHLDASSQIAFAETLGEPTQGHPTLPVVDGEAQIFDLDSIAGASANHWHTDVTFVERPPTFSILRAVIVPDVGGNTLWANTVSGYNDLPPNLRQLADGLSAVHSNGHDYGRVDVASLCSTFTEEQLDYLTAFISQVFETQHPVVRIHAETGERALLLGGFAYRLVGHASAESVDLIRILQSYVTRPENVVSWRWQPGDVAVWDNRSTQHYAICDYAPARRKMQRVTTGGVRVEGVDGSRSKSLQGDDSRYYLAR